MKYKLKPGVESFEVVDGAFAGKKYFRGKVYEKIPPEERGRFEKVEEKQPAVTDKTTETVGNKKVRKEEDQKVG